ncbi:hypothetical protein TNIN_64511 [Trichonephila inaurata madagascariensis]|uniref:Uncharacterized protein n=1 Tax=Trichonephila inaurata madagascariensis TaxID=2747483 RepID=A0A8X6YGA4_9ARAC|nr:hypothetical protein TNIN_64511 [Trichonephila inaurata madagascariensis]
MREAVLILHEDMEREAAAERRDRSEANRAKLESSINSGIRYYFSGCKLQERKGLLQNEELSSSSVKRMELDTARDFIPSF